MNLSEFLTYCTLKGLVNYKIKIDSKLTAYDVEADAHYKIQIANDDYKLDMIYAVVGESAVIVKFDLGRHFPMGHEVLYQPGVADMVECFCK